MRINASRTQAHLVHYKDQQTLLLARQRAERRVYEEKEKHQLRLQQLSHRKQLSSDNKDCNSKTIPPRRKSYRVDKSHGICFVSIKALINNYLYSSFMAQHSIS
ncbi:uncharacterized protein PHALS_04596 [Plasmopara halstedii]|uniref:Uncharacterized protein n=1 Tax=Plasmopara halstedii TaxID=4781 RepID=A0A0P1A976_PLAHL|nr:uncharacterized protein PHALS_04596 [Plasmopara halstedii]CEG37145.1 hypothetical protein PHALS_04596 [Plasmopara halstedii]|eukprot:XP_024573514.1 hypothetical protein PHALS_04596 [Plasmopara halstedii]